MKTKLPYWLNKFSFYRFGFIGNANAGPSRRSKNQEQLFKIQTLINELNEMVDVELDYKDFISFIMTSSVSDIAPSLRRLINEKKIKVLFIFGGDGSLHLVLDILMYEFFVKRRIDYIPVIASLGGGTMLAVHSWLGWNRNSYENMKKIIYTDFDLLPVRKVKLLAIDLVSPTNEREPRFGFMFIMGAITRVIDIYNSGNRSMMSGIKHFFAGMTGSIFGWPKSHQNVTANFIADVYINGEKILLSDFMSIICSKNDSLMFGDQLHSIKPFAGRAASNQFYFLTSSFSAAQISMLAPLLYKGLFKPNIKSLINKPITEAVIIPEMENSVFIDGEIYRCLPGEPIVIKVGKSVDFVAWWS